MAERIEVLLGVDNLGDMVLDGVPPIRREGRSMQLCLFTLFKSLGSIECMKLLGIQGTLYWTGISIPHSYGTEFDAAFAKLLCFLLKMQKYQSGRLSN